MDERRAEITVSLLPLRSQCVVAEAWGNQTGTLAVRSVYGDNMQQSNECDADMLQPNQ